MESNEQMEHAKQRQTQSEQDDSCGWGRLGGRGIEQKGKRTQGQQCSDCRGGGGL